MVRFYLLFYILLVCLPLSSQVFINEVSTANDSYFIDENGEYKDWIELYNPGLIPFSLAGYSLVRVEDGKNKKWFFPSFATIPPLSYLTIFSSGKDYNFFIDHLEIPVAYNGSWKYIEGTSEPDPTWREIGYDDSGWSTGVGSFGYGDGDDSTIISPLTSFYLRKSFNVPDMSIFNSAILIMDYDDAFVAYLNGIEIARSNIYTSAFPLFSDTSYEEHEAQYYQGGSPDYYFINDQILNTLLVNGNNVLTIQIHNNSASSSDLTCFADLIMGSTSSTPVFPIYGFFSVFIAHTSFGLSSNGTHIKLLNSLDNVVDQKTIPELQTNNTYARIPDGSNNWCITNEPTPSASNDAINCYTAYAPISSFSPNAGFYSSPQWITLSTPPGCSTYYTIGGDEPTQSSALYSGPIYIDSTSVIRVRNFASGSILPSAIITNTYLINETFTLPVLSIAADSSELFDPITGLYYNLYNDALKITAHCEYFKSNNGILGFEAEHYLRLHGNYSQTFAQRSLKVILSDDLGQQYINYTIIPEKPNVTKYKSFNIRNGGVDNFPLGIGMAFDNPTHFADDFQQRAAGTTHVDYIGSQPCIVFLNGIYWGLYEIRERGDENYLEQNHGINPDKVDIIRFENDVLEGSIDNFNIASNFVISGNMADPSSIAIANQLFDLENVCDYFISQTYYGNADWIYSPGVNNIRFWCTTEPLGKWRYVFWDVEAGCGIYNQPLDYDELSPALDSLNCNHSAIMSNLLDNPFLRNYFINRYADLMNTIFIPDSMVEHINYFRDLLYQDMPRHIQRWDVTGTIPVTQWLANIDTLTAYVYNRPPYAREIVRSYFGLNKVVDVTLATDPQGAGKIKISTITPGPLPWTGKYFDGNPVTLTQIANPGFMFSHWETLQSSYIPNTILSLNIDTSQTLIAHYVRADETIYAYPNPFSDYFTLIYQIPVDKQLKISIYDISGKCLGIPVSENQVTTQGSHQLIIQPEMYGMNSGIYFIEMIAGNYKQTIKVVHVSNNN